jgi:ribosomal protein L7/L12
MFKIKFYGWSVGAKKISFVKILSEFSGVSLHEAKQIKDDIIDKGLTIYLNVEEENQAIKIVKELTAIGFMVKYKEIS